MDEELHMPEASGSVFFCPLWLWQRVQQLEAVGLRELLRVP